MTDDPKPDAQIDQASEDSFPASDPPSHTPSSRAGQSDRTHRDADRDQDAGAAGEAIPKGTPTSHRHEAEITAPRIDSDDHPERDQR